MKILFDIYSDMGSIISDSGSEVTMPPSNLLDGVPSYWSSLDSVGPHTISGTITIGEDYPAPIDTFAINIGSAPSGIIATLRVFDTLVATTPIATHSIILSGTPGWKFFNITSTYVIQKWELAFTNTVFAPFRVVASRVLAGLSWLPNMGVSSDISIDKLPYSKPVRFRNGGVYVPPSISYTTHLLNYQELDHQTTFSLQDSLANYGSGATIFVFGLEGTTALTFTTLYGRIKEWGKPKLSVSGKYSLSITIEETK